MRYFGSKATALSALTELVGPSRKPGSDTLCDPFGGMGVVGSHFRSLGYRVTSGDVLAFAHLFQVARIQQTRRPNCSSLRDVSKGIDPWVYLADAPPTTSWITREFAERRQFFTVANARKIDGIRIALDRWHRDGLLSTAQEAYFYAALIQSMDRVANTAGTYYAHLKGWTRRAQKPFVLRPVQQVAGPRGSAVLADATEVASIRHWNILYLDPPYNERDYARYYHLPETIATRRPHRATGRSGVPRTNAHRSRFTTTAAAEELASLIARASFDRLVVHYSDDGLIRPDALQEVLRGCGRMKRVPILASGYSTSHGPRTVGHTVYIVQ